MKDMACRTLLLKLERQGYLQLPPPRIDFSNRRRFRSVRLVEHPTVPIESDLRLLRPLYIETITGQSESFQLWVTFLKKYHYLGFTGSVGENMKYLIRERRGRPLAALLFGSAAWKAKARDAFIGWDAKRREVGIQWMTNNMRFLILPWVHVPHLASHILGAVARRIVHDWQLVYGHPIYMLETFVERQRFRGTCYKAANWIHVGSTQGRTRDDRHHIIQVSIKDIWVYPLTPRFRERLKVHPPPGP